MSERASPAPTDGASEERASPQVRGDAGKRRLHEDTLRKIEQAAGRVATQSVARMDDELPWFRALPADQRSWVMLVAQAGIASFVEWLRSPDDVLRLTGEVFATAPRAMARTVSLQHTVELVRETISVAEEQVPLLAAAGDEGVLREELLRFSREIAFAAARVYAGAAESRGAWDARLEALVIEGLVRGGGIGAPESQVAALGWRTTGPVTTVAGIAPDQEHAQDILAEVHRLAHRTDYDVIAGVHGGRLIVVLSGIAEPLTAARDILPVFARRARRSRLVYQRCGRRHCCYPSRAERAARGPGVGRRPTTGERGGTTAGACPRRRCRRATGAAQPCLSPAGQCRGRLARDRHRVLGSRRIARGHSPRAVRPPQYGPVPAAPGR